MISPDEVKRQALRWWRPFLQSIINNEDFFPKSIERIGKVHPQAITQRFEALQKEIALLYRYSKNQTGTGYLVKTEERNFRRTGNQELPEAIIFDTVDDYVSFTGKGKEWKLFLSNYEKIRIDLPWLKQWASHHCLWLTDIQVNWADILKVCRYFIDNPRPDLYLRQLPVPVHTKFIEENSTIIQSLLDFLIPSHIRNIHQKRFAERYFLRYDEPLVRMRLLDNKLSCFGNFQDISIPFSDFEKLDLPVKNILIAENKMNFLTLPALPFAVAVWSGGGFNISYLRNAAWLLEKNIYYWGDIDEYGFQILHQLRSYYPKSQSVMMDCVTFDGFKDFTVDGVRNKSEYLSLLNEEENRLFNRLKSMSGKNRLEQEKIPQIYADEYLKNAIK
jgi:hypothetical protein